jgi:hypothetical protein
MPTLHTAATCRRPARRCRTGLACLCLALAAASASATATVATADDRTGEQIYRAECVRCHGAHGEGSAEAKRALAGDKTTDQLAKLVTESMPEDDPGTCTGDDARKVSAYLFDAFYSRTARERNKPPRIELSRLTVRQYRSAVADLIGSFRSPGTWDDQRGLHGEYFDGRNLRSGARVIDRRDPVVRFDFGEGTPDPAKFKGSDFTIRWEGSVLAPDTGEYEFVVHTEHALRLFVNDTRKPLIDAWVKSGNDTVFRAPIRLFGGRAYPVRLEFSKAKQGVDDSKTNKAKKPGVKASIALLWKPPHRVEEVIPERNLAPARSPETFVVETPFPPDDRSVGYERGDLVLSGLVPAHDRRGDRDRRIRRGAPPRAERRFRKCRRPPGAAPRVCPDVGRAGVPAAAGDRAGRPLRRAAVPGGERPGAGRQAGRARGAQVAAVPLPGDRRRPARPV